MFKHERNKKLYEDVLHEVAKRHQIEIIELSVMPDHIHTVVIIPPAMSVFKALQLLKGVSARELFKRRTYFRRRYPKGHFWSSGKFYRSVGDADEETVLQYVRDQRLQQTSLDVFPTTTTGALQVTQAYMPERMSQHKPAIIVGFIFHIMFFLSLIGMLTGFSTLLELKDDKNIIDFFDYPYS
jgi:putative transposase